MMKTKNYIKIIILTYRAEQSAVVSCSAAHTHVQFPDEDRPTSGRG